MPLTRLTLVAFLIAGPVTSCSSRQSQTSATAVDDSVRMLLAAYEHDQISLDSAVQRLADVLEPLGGLSASGSVSPKAREALEATGRELARRAGRHR